VNPGGSNELAFANFDNNDKKAIALATVAGMELACKKCFACNHYGHHTGSPNSTRGTRALHDKA